MSRRENYTMPLKIKEETIQASIHTHRFPMNTPSRNKLLKQTHCGLLLPPLQKFALHPVPSPIPAIRLGRIFQEEGDEVARYRAFTSQASRRPSPRKFRASSVVTSTPPGKRISHQ